MRVHLQETLIRTESTSSTWETNLFNKLHGLQMPFPLPLLWLHIKQFYLCRTKHTRSHIIFVLYSFCKQVDRTFTWVRYLLQQYQTSLGKSGSDFQHEVFRPLPLKRPHWTTTTNADALSLFLETLCPGVYLSGGRCMHPVLCVCIHSCCFLWSVADKISLELCGADESHVSGLSI